MFTCTKEANFIFNYFTLTRLLIDNHLKLKLLNAFLHTYYTKRTIVVIFFTKTLNLEIFKIKFIRLRKFKLATYMFFLPFEYCMYQ